MMYLLLSGSHPFKATGSMMELSREILKGKISMEGEVWRKVSAPAKDLLGCLLNRWPEKRITAKVGGGNSCRIAEIKINSRKNFTPTCEQQASVHHSVCLFDCFSSPSQEALNHPWLSNGRTTSSGISPLGSGSMGDRVKSPPPSDPGGMGNMMLQRLRWGTRISPLSSSQFTGGFVNICLSLASPDFICFADESGLSQR